MCSIPLSIINLRSNKETAFASQQIYINKNPEYKTGNPGKPVAFVYIDDRAVCYKGQNAKQLLKELNNFEVYYKK